MLLYPLVAGEEGGALAYHLGWAEVGAGSQGQSREPASNNGTHMVWNQDV